MVHYDCINCVDSIHRRFHIFHTLCHRHQTKKEPRNVHVVYCSSVFSFLFSSLSWHTSQKINVTFLLRISRIKQTSEREKSSTRSCASACSRGDKRLRAVYLTFDYGTRM